jgi:hypothetical protein
MPAGPGRRLTPLRSGNIRWLKALSGQRHTGPAATNWASCNKNVTTVHFRHDIFIPVTRGGLYFSNTDLSMIGLLTLPITAFLAPGAVTGYTLGPYVGAAVGKVFVPNILGAISAGLAAAGIRAETKTKFTNFQRPCSDAGGN